MELALPPRIDPEVDDTIDLVNQMVRQAQSGDAGAFEGVYRTHVGRIHALCLRMSGDAQAIAATSHRPFQQRRHVQRSPDILRWCVQVSESE